MNSPTLFEIAMYIYKSMDEVIEDKETIYGLRRGVDISLRKLSNTLHKKYDFVEAEEIMTLILDYGVYLGKQNFAMGVEQGVMLCRALNEAGNNL